MLAVIWSAPPRMTYGSANCARIFSGDGVGARLLDPHVVLDGLHTADSARHFDSLRGGGLRADETTELHNALEGLDVDLGDLQRGFIQDGRLHFGCDHRVVHVLARAFLLRRGCATRHRHQCYDQKQGRKVLAKLGHCLSHCLTPVVLKATRAEMTRSLFSSGSTAPWRHLRYT